MSGFSEKYQDEHGRNVQPTSAAVYGQLLAADIFNNLQRHIVAWAHRGLAPPSNIDLDRFDSSVVSRALARRTPESDERFCQGHVEIAFDDPNRSFGPRFARLVRTGVFAEVGKIASPKPRKREGQPPRMVKAYILSGHPHLDVAENTTASETLMRLFDVIELWVLPEMAATSERNSLVKGVRQAIARQPDTEAMQEKRAERREKLEEENKLYDIDDDDYWGF